jgi:uncharacterized membrane protein YccC
VAISAFRVTRSSLAMSLATGATRVAGSTIGAVTGVVVLGLFAYDQPAFCASLFVLAWLALFGFATSRFGNAWLFFGITANLVMLMALEQPQIGFAMAVDRVIDVAIGTAAAFIVAMLLPDPRPVAGALLAGGTPPPPMPFWTRRNKAAFERWLEENWPVVMHATRGGVIVMLLPFVAHYLAPLSSTQVGVTAVAVMSIPTTAIRDADGRMIVERSAHRVIGCVLGALLGLVFVKASGSDFPLWLGLLMAGTWLGSQVQSGTTGISYIGTQAGIALLMTLVQGQGPAQSVAPGFTRLVGMTAGLVLLLVVSMIFALFRTPLRE